MHHERSRCDGSPLLTIREKPERSSEDPVQPKIKIIKKKKKKKTDKTRRNSTEGVRRGAWTLGVWHGSETWQQFQRTHWCSQVEFHFLVFFKNTRNTHPQKGTY